MKQPGSSQNLFLLHLFLVLALLVIVFGTGYYVFLKYFDGVGLHPLFTFKMPVVANVEPTSHISDVPAPQGSDLIATYQVQTDKNSYKTGETIYITVSLCKLRDIDATFQWSFLDTLIKSTVPKADSNFPLLACYTNVKIATVDLPKELALEGTPGEQIHLHGYVAARINALRTIGYGLISNNFTIIK
jgi:hypothetical protein